MYLLEAGQLAKNQHINGYELFSDMLNYICSPVTDGWSTFEIILEESAEEPDLLRLMTKVVYPENEDYFVGQIGQHFNNIKDARTAIGQYIHIYNFERRHSAFDYQTPAECYYPAMLLPYVA